MTKSDEGSFLARVRSRLGDLHPAERRLADFVLDFPGERASYSASELANVSNAMVSRFVRRLGYANYEEARLNVRRTFAQISIAELDGLADAVLDARRVLPIGMRAGHVFAGDLRRQPSQGVADTTPLPLIAPRADDGVPKRPVEL